MLLNAADKALWRLALPMIFSNITVPLLGLVDTAVIGHLDSPVYLGGVAVGATATSFLFMLLLFLRMSTTGLTAQAWGAKDPQRLARALVQPLALALGAGVLIILLRLPLIDLALHIVGGSEAVLEQARRFLEIRWLSAPASLANLVLLGWLLGVQYARAPVILLVVGNLLNIVLDLWLVMGLRMNVQGAALATVTAEYATLIIGLLMAKRVLTLRGVSLAMLKNAWRGDLRRLLALNRDIMLRSLLLQLCFLYYALAFAGVSLGVIRTGIIALGVYTGAYMGEVVRAAIESVPKGQFEAAQAQGFNYLQRMGYIILPQSIPVMLPPMVNQVVNLFKNTSCLYIVGGADLISVTYSFVTGASTGGAYAPAYIVCGLIFFVVCFPLSTLAARWEASLKERKGRVNTSLKTAAKKVELKEAA